MPSFALSAWPLFLFGVLEPISLVWAYIIIMQSPVTFYSGQAPVPLSRSGFPPQALSMTLQLGNVLLLLAPMALICIWTKHAEISKWYLISVALADLGHIYAVYAAVGSDYFFNPGAWNDTTWGNVGFSAFLHINRLLTVAGAFGRVGGKASLEKKTL